MQNQAKKAKCDVGWQKTQSLCPGRQAGRIHPLTIRKTTVLGFQASPDQQERKGLISGQPCILHKALPLNSGFPIDLCSKYLYMYNRNSVKMSFALVNHGCHVCWVEQWVSHLIYSAFGSCFQWSFKKACIPIYAFLFTHVCMTAQYNICTLNLQWLKSC